MLSNLGHFFQAYLRHILILVKIVVNASSPRSSSVSSFGIFVVARLMESNWPRAGQSDSAATGN